MRQQASRDIKASSVVRSFLSAIALLLLGCSTTQPNAPQKPQPVAPRPPLTWEAASQSNDISVYARYLRENPTTGHRSEIRQLSDKFLREKAVQAKQEGKKLVSNATRLDLTLISHGPVILTPGSVLRVEDGEVFLGGMHYYSDPTNPVNIIVEKQGTRITGKGIGIASDTVYCFGF